MSWFSIACVVIGSWTIAGFVIAVPLGKAIRRGTEIVKPADDSTWLEPWPTERSPLDLTGYALDAEFFATLAPSFPEYR